jgi:protein-arginine kinase activator protein McsA
MVNLIKKIILEEIQKINNITKVICDKCKHEWDLEDGGDEPYVCHNILSSGRMCNHDNTPKKKLKKEENILNEKCWKGYTQKGMKTMFGKRYPNCVKITKEELQNYKGSHKAPTKNYGARMDNLEKMYDAIYTNKALQEYGQNYPFDRLAIKIIQQAKGQENKLIRIYRAVPKDVNVINSGDWVSTTEEYANEHGEAVLDNDFKVISKVVPAYTLYTDGGSIHEWGYNP